MAERARNNFDVIRLVLAALVLLSHSFEIIDGSRVREPLTASISNISSGALAVDLFFILSGFFIKGSWDRSVDGREFLKKRIARIYPGFLVATAFSILLAGTIGAANAADYLLRLDLIEIAWNAMLLNVPVTPPVFLGTFYPGVNEPLWTIKYEAGCYLALLILGLSGLLGRRAILPLLWGTAFVIYEVQSFNIFDLHLGDAADIPRLAMMFLAGALYAQYPLYRMAGWGSVVFCTLFLLACMPLWFLTEPVIAVAGSFLLLAVGHARALVPNGLAIPDISYGTYLYGWPVQKLIVHHIPTIMPMPLFWLSLMLSLACGCFSWFLVERPMLRHGRRRSTLSPQCA